MSKNKSTPNQKTHTKRYLDLLYMTPNLITAKDIAKQLEQMENLKVELWGEMNILELELSNGNTVDIEPVDNNFKDSSDAAFVKNRGIQTIFAITLDNDDLTEVVGCFENIIGNLSGFLCTDSEDFTPFYTGTHDKL